jgi:hypothetical protein
MGLQTVSNPVKILIEASNHRCCAPSCQDKIVECFAYFARRDVLAGALVCQPEGLSRVQLCRAVREAELGDTFMVFESREEAQAFLREF